MITFSCPSCQTEFSVEAGKQEKCPGCGRIVPIRSAETAALPKNSPDPTQGPPQLDESHESSLIDFLAPPQASDELGQLGKYRILKVVGHGGMGVVFKAEDATLKRIVAIKAMLPTLAASASAGKRFLREAQAMAAVEHDHIVRIHQVDEDRGVPFMVMEFLKGESLDERLEHEVKLPLLDVVRIGREIAEALGAAHAKGLIHRDVKPANIWLEAPRGRVKILDFGLARAVSESSSLTQQGTIIGTPAYMAPEQGRGEAVDARCDLFSLGIVLYRMCTGRQPFQGKDAVSTLMEVALHRPPAPIRLNAEIPQVLSELVMRLLEKDADRRPASAAEVLQVLGSAPAWLDGVPQNLLAQVAPALPAEVSENAIPSKFEPAPRPQAKKRRGRTRLLIALGLLVLALLCGWSFLVPLILGGIVGGAICARKTRREMAGGILGGVFGGWAGVKLYRLIHLQGASDNPSLFLTSAYVLMGAIIGASVVALVVSPRNH